jgi:uncharacterized protein YutD
MGYDLLQYKEARILAFIDDKAKLEKRISELETYIYELCDKDCPKDYKKIVQQDVFYGKSV